MTLADVWRERISCIIHTSTQEEADMLFKVVDSYDHDGTTWASWWNTYRKKTCYRTNLGQVVAYGCTDDYIENGEEVIEFSDLVATGGYCDGFGCGKIPTSLNMEVVKNRTKTMEDWIDTLTNGWAKLGCTTFRVSPSEVDELIKKTEEKKMSTTFTFFTKEGYRYDKSNNTKIPTITTKVICTSYDSVYHGAATCDKSNYDERQGCLEAIANAMFGGNFDKQYRKAVKFNNTFDLAARTCDYCGKVFDTADERREHEAWHVERRKARHERYLLRKRAKEIAFEEQAQKMAKEMMGEQK